jgi:hypothetical protein
MDLWQCPTRSFNRTTKPVELLAIIQADNDTVIFDVIAQTLCRKVARAAYSLTMPRRDRDAHRFEPVGHRKLKQAYLALWTWNDPPLFRSIKITCDVVYPMDRPIEQMRSTLHTDRAEFSWGSIFFSMQHVTF